MTNRETRAFALDLRAIGEDGTIEGYGSVFGVQDSYGDVVAHGAFKASLAAHKAGGTMPAMLWQHDSAVPIGVWTDMSEDDKGLKIKGRLSLRLRRAERLTSFSRPARSTDCLLASSRPKRVGTTRTARARFLASIFGKCRW